MKKFKIDFRDKRIGIPIILFLGIILFTVIWKLNYEEEPVEIVDESNLKHSIAEVSDFEKDKELYDKFEAYEEDVKEQRWKVSAVRPIEVKAEETYSDEEYYSEEEKKQIEEQKNSEIQEIDNLIKSLEDGKNKVQEQSVPAQSKEEDSSSYFDDMKKQYLFLDSLEKANDPDYQEKVSKEKRQKAIQEEKDRLDQSTFLVEKGKNRNSFNSIQSEDEGEFIKAVVDINTTGYNGSRLRLRLLEDIRIGNIDFEKNSYLYAKITGFAEQRVNLTVSSVMVKNDILPINLTIYDIDGLKGLYVPNSQFREFTKELGNAGLQGMSGQDMEENGNFYMSIVSKMFQSTSRAVSNQLRKNKAKIKYGSFIFLIDERKLNERLTQLTK